MSKENGGPASDKIQQARRELFEAWATRQHGGLGRRDDGEYFDDLTHGAWLGFNAALDLAVIELPLGAPGYMSDTEESCFMHGVSYCRAAIESTSLGIKVK